MGAFQEYMVELDKKIEAYRVCYKDVSLIAILRLIYIDLGQKMNFDINYTFGNAKQKRSIYDRPISEEALEEAFEKRKIICKSLAYMIKMIVPRYGFNCVVEYELNEYGKVRPGAHVYNVIKTPDGKKFVIDLEEDLEFIQTGAKTHFFAVDMFDRKTNIYSEDEIRDIDKEIGYIPEGIYMDDTLWMMDKAISGGISDDDLFEFVLDNLNKYRDIRNIGYRDRMLYYERMIDYFFYYKKRVDANGRLSIDRIERCNCYRVIDGEKKYIPCFITKFTVGAVERIYLFDYEKNSFEEVSIEEFSTMLRDGLEVPNDGIAKRLKTYSNKMCSAGPDL